MTKTFSTKHDFGNQTVIRDHHSDWSEEHLQIVGQFSTTSVTWIHGNVATEFLAKRNFLVVELEHELLAGLVNFVAEQRLSNLKNLLGDHRQHFNLNTVELIEAGPGTSLSQTREERVHEIEIDLIRAVEHNTKYCNSLGQILC